MCCDLTGVLSFLTCYLAGVQLTDVSLADVMWGELFDVIWGEMIGWVCGVYEVLLTDVRADYVKADYVKAD